jgi:hypothetical protein
MLILKNLKVVHDSLLSKTTAAIWPPRCISHIAVNRKHGAQTFPSLQALRDLLLAKSRNIYVNVFLHCKACLMFHFIVFSPLYKLRTEHTSSLRQLQ